MKSTVSKFLTFLKLIWNFRKTLKFIRINKKLYKTIEDREVDRIILKGKIVKMVKNFIAINTSSDFIPPWYKSNTEIREEVYNKYGNEMRTLGVKLYQNLKLSA